MHSIAIRIITVPRDVKQCRQHPSDFSHAADPYPLAVDDTENPSDPTLPDLTWPALLARWTTLAKASASLPATKAGDRWWAAVPAIIGLQAVTMALRDLGDLPDDERALGLTKADILIKQYATQINALWRGEDLGEELPLLISDARAALDEARHTGVEWTVSADRAIAPDWDMVLGALSRADIATLGLLMLPAPGELLVNSSPIAFAAKRFGGQPSGTILAMLTEALGADSVAVAPSPGPRQVYRQLHSTNSTIESDLIAPIATALPPGRPLLHEAIIDGVQHPAPPRVAQQPDGPLWPITVHKAD